MAEVPKPSDCSRVRRGTIKNMLSALFALLLFGTISVAQDKGECQWSETAEVKPRPFPAPHGPLTIRIPEHIRSWRVAIEPADRFIAVSVFKAMPREKYCDVQVRTVPHQLEDGGPELRLAPDTLDLGGLSGAVQRVGIVIAVPEALRVNIVHDSRPEVSHIVNDKYTMLRDGSAEPVVLQAMDYFLNELVWPAPIRTGLLESAKLRAVTVPDHGGEIGSLAVLHQGRWIELLYRAMDYAARTGWTGKAPFLFPATGRNFPKDVTPNEEARGSSYDWKGKRLPMPIHGFARDLPWKVVTHSKTRARLSLTDSEATRRSYPFGFQATVDYAIKDSSLVFDYTITASRQNSEPMRFAAGNHITFRTPLVPGSDPLKMTFESPSTVEYLKAAGGLPTGEKRNRSFASATALSEIPANAAISLGGYENDPHMVLRDPAGITIRMKQTSDSVPADPVIRFNVWGDARNGYFSPEPWVGLQNSFNLDKGMVRLEPGQSWKWRIELTVETE